MMQWQSFSTGSSLPSPSKKTRTETFQWGSFLFRSGLHVSEGHMLICPATHFFSHIYSMDIYRLKQCWSLYCTGICKAHQARSTACIDVWWCFPSAINTFIRIKEAPIFELSMFLVFAYSSYIVADLLGFTGIISIFFCGVAMAHYAYDNLSKVTLLASKVCN